MKEQITELTHPSMFAWFTKYIYEYKEILDDPKNGLENGKLEFEYNYSFKNKLSYIKYPYGDVDYFIISETNFIFLINSPIHITKNFTPNSSKKLLSFKGFPKKVDGNMNIRWLGEQYSLSYKNKDKYKIYLAMWLEMLDSVTEKERWEYINVYKDINDYVIKCRIIPKELLLEFGVL